MVAIQGRVSQKPACSDPVHTPQNLSHPLKHTHSAGSLTSLCDQVSEVDCGESIWARRSQAWTITESSSESRRHPSPSIPYTLTDEFAKASSSPTAHTTWLSHE